VYRYSLLPIICLLMIGGMMSPGFAATKSSSSFNLVSNGKPNATIVVSRHQSKSAAFAVEELQYHIRKITGTILPVVFDNQKIKGNRILVGDSLATNTLKLGKPLASQEYMVKFLPKTIVLLGKDDISPSGTKDILPRVQGKFGRAIKFDGVTSFLGVNDPGFTDDEGTLEAWIWMPAKTQVKDGTILRMDGGSPWTYQIVQRLMNSSIIDYRIYDGTNGSGVDSTPLTEGWHHIMATHSQSSGKLELFVDGVSQGTAPIKKTACAGATLYIGGMPGNGQESVNAFSGIIDEVRVSTVVRTVAPGGPTAAYKQDSSTALLFHLDEESGRPTKFTGTPDSAMAPDYFTEKGTMDAVYEFLERFCGVDWCAPGEIGLICPKTNTLVVKGSDIRRHPAFRYRWMTPSGLYMISSKDRFPDNEAALWKYRMHIGGEPFWACHSFYGYYDRFLKTHPDWFAQGYSGEPPQMCYTNQGFIDQTIKDAREYFDTGKSYPGASISGPNFGLVPQDNGSWCQCPACQAKMTESEKDNPQFSNGKRSNYLFEFVNKVAVETRKTNPNKWISALAYADYAYYPDKVKLEPNVSVMMCLHTRNWWCPSMEKNDLKVFNAWTSNEAGKRPLYVWLYYCFPALQAKSDGFATFPGFFVHTLARQTRMYHKAGIRGIFLEHSSEFDQSFLGDQLEMYVQWRLADNPNQDLEKLINKFFNNYYGKAAKPMMELYLDIEKTFSSPSTYPESIQKSPAHQHQTRQLTYEYEATPERIANYQKLIQQAKELAGNENETKRIELFDKALIQPMVEGIEKYKAYKLQLKASLPKVLIPKITVSNPGDIKAVDWSTALDIGRWSTVGGDKSDRQISSRIAHDGQFLYVELQEKLDTSKLAISGQVWGGDDWEMFFAQKRESPYRQFIVDPNGKFGTIAYGESKSEWVSGAHVVSDTSTGNMWLVRSAIPLGSLLPKALGSGDTFYANLYRATSGSSGLMAWSPNMKGSFHELSRMGEFTLGK